MFPCFIRSSSADVKQNKRSRVYRIKIQSFSNCRLKMMPIFEIITLCTLCRRCRRQDATEASRLPSQNKSFLQLLAYLAQPPSAFTSSFGTAKAGRGALEPPPEDGARTKRFYGEIPVPRILYWGRDENNSRPSPCALKKRIIIYIQGLRMGAGIRRRPCFG